MAQGFGFQDYEQARGSLGDELCDSNVPRLRNRIEVLETELRKHVAVSKEILQHNNDMQQENQKARQEIERLRQRLDQGSPSKVKEEVVTPNVTPVKRRRGKVDKENRCVYWEILFTRDLKAPHSPLSPSSARITDLTQPAAHVAALQAQLADLRERYEHLAETKEKLSGRYKEDFRKWKSFKTWVSTSDQGTKGTAAHRRLEKIRKRKGKSGQRKLVSLS